MALGSELYLGGAGEKEGTLLFESLAEQLYTYEELYRAIEDILYCGRRIPFSIGEKSINLGAMFGFLKDENGRVAVANRMFEMFLLNNERGEEQLADYLEYYRKDKGYMLSSNFNKRKEIGVKEIKIGNKTIIEAVV